MLPAERQSSQHLHRLRSEEETTGQVTYRTVSSVGRALVWRSGGPGFNSRCLPVLEMGSPDVVTGREVGSRAVPVALEKEKEPSHKWEELKACVEGSN